MRNNPRDGYEFEMIGTEDDDEAGRRLNGSAGGKYGKGKPRRGGDLYDAFAAGSDEEDDLYSDDEYEDTPDSSGESKSDNSDEKAGQQ